MVKINQILLYSLLLGGIFFFFFGYIHENDYIYLGFFASFLFGLFIKKFIIEKYKLDEKYFTFILILLCLNMAGEYYLYNLRGLDKLMHFSGAILGTSILLELFKKTRRKIKKINIWLIIVGLSVLWELFDWVLFYYFNLPIMGVWINGQMIVSPYKDTLLDIIWCSVGSFVYLILKK